MINRLLFMSNRCSGYILSIMSGKIINIINMGDSTDERSNGIFTKLY